MPGSLVTHKPEEASDFQLICSCFLNSVVPANIQAGRLCPQDMPEGFIQHGTVDEAAASSLKLDGDGPILFQVIAL